MTTETDTQLPAKIYCHTVEIRLGIRCAQWGPCFPESLPDEIRAQLEEQVFNCMQAGGPVYATAEAYTPIRGRWVPIRYFRVIG